MMIYLAAEKRLTLSVILNMAITGPRQVVTFESYNKQK